MIVRSGDSDTDGSGSASIMSAMTFGGVKYRVAADSCANGATRNPITRRNPKPVIRRILRMASLAEVGWFFSRVVLLRLSLASHKWKKMLSQHNLSGCAQGPSGFFRGDPNSEGSSPVRMPGFVVG